MATGIIPPFGSFIPMTPVIPKLYWDVKSEEQRYHRLCETLNKLACFIDTVKTQININTEDIDELQAMFERFMASGFDDYYAAQVAQWIADHMTEIIDMLNQSLVFFGLTDDGYFTAYVPERYAFILDTVMDYTDDNYGKLEIIY